MVWFLSFGLGFGIIGFGFFIYSLMSFRWAIEDLKKHNEK